MRELKGPLMVKIKMNNKEWLVHVNRVRPLLRADQTPTTSAVPGRWSPPLFQYYHKDPPEPVAPNESPPSLPGCPMTTRSGRVVKPVDYYGIEH